MLMKRDEIPQINLDLVEFQNHVVRANLRYCRHHHGNHGGYELGGTLIVGHARGP